MTKEHVIEQLRRRCATRSAAAARAARSSSSRSPTPTPASTRASRRPAASPTRGRRPCSTSTTSCCAATSRTRRSWAPGVAWTPDADRAPSRATRTRPTRSRSPTVIPSSGDPTPQLPGRAGRRRSTTRRRTPRACAARCRTTWSTCSGARPEDGFAGRPVGNVGIQYGLQGARWRARSRPAQFVDLNTKIGGVRHRLQPDRGAHRRRPPGARARLPQRRGQPGRQPRPGRDHRPARPRPGRVPRRLPHLRRCARGWSASTARPPTRCCGAARCRCSATRTTSTSRSSRWTRGWPRSRRTRATSRSRRRSSRTSPTTLADRCTNGAGQDVAGRRLRRDRPGLLATRRSRRGCR